MTHAARSPSRPLAPRTVAGRWVVLGIALGVLLGPLASAAFAQRFDPPPGAELLVTDERSETLIGFGLAEADGVTLELASDAPGTWRVVVVTPGGASRPYDARWDGERLILENEGGAAFDAADALGPQGRTLTLTWWDGGTTEVPTDRFVARTPAPAPSEAEEATAADAPDVPASNRPSRPSTASRDENDAPADDGAPAAPPVAEDPGEDAPTDPPPDAGANRPGGNDGGAPDDGGDAPDDDADAPPSSNR